MEQLVPVLQVMRKTQEIAVLLRKTQSRLASIHIKQENFQQAEKMYHEAYHRLLSGSQSSGSVGARYLEREAWAQVRQGKYREARENYWKLLEPANFPRQTVLCNLGFIETRLGNLEQAKSHFNDALSLPIRTPEDEIEHRYTESALFACLHKTGKVPEAVNEVIKPLKIDFSIHSFYTSAGLFADSPFHFASTRLLESLLSTCSIPVSDDNGNRGILFVDMLFESCYSDTRLSYFKFRVLVQCQMRFRNLHNHRVNPADTGFTERLKATCQGHLVWIFKMAAIGPNDTWQSDYDHFAFGTKYKNSKPPTNARPLSRVAEGAYQFSKLWLYLNAWPQDWEFVLDLLYLRLGDWLQYLRKHRHMENLWVERQDSQPLKPYDTISPFGYPNYRTFPRYHLSDSTLLWLAFRQLECLFDHIKSRCQAATCSEEAKIRILELQEKFESYQDVCNTPKLRSKILETFTVSDQQKPTSPHLGTQLTGFALKKIKQGQPQAGESISSTEGAASDPQRPPYVQMEEKFISPDTLEAYGLPWERNLVSESHSTLDLLLDRKSETWGDHANRLLSC